MPRARAKWLLIPLLAVSVSATQPVVDYPDVGTAEGYAHELVSRLSPAQLDSALAMKPGDIPLTLRTLGSATATTDLALQMRLTRYLTDLAALRGRRADRDGVITGDEVRDVTAFLLVDPVRFTRDPDFRRRVTPLLPRALDASHSMALRERSLSELTAAARLDFDTMESIASAWSAIHTRSAERRVEFAPCLRMPDDLSGPIRTSVFSLSSTFFPASGDARAFLTAVRNAVPQRRIVVLADTEMREALRGIDVTVVPTFSRPYTPWPRDPFTVARTAEGRVVLVNRPNLQPGREEDANMARALATADADLSWSVAPFPFHNGHILLTPKAAWISIHTVEIRALEILGLEAVPVKTFAAKEGVERYLGAVRRAAKELETIYGRPVRFVHPLRGEPAAMQKLGGGGGFDLDSLVTMLPQSDGSLVALVGDIAAGVKLAQTADWKNAKAAYGISGNVAEAQSSRGTQALAVFLDTVASHLTANGVAVRRLPLLNVPRSLAKDAPDDFLLTWNNVVLEPGRAEGFASLLAEGDAAARGAFKKAGYDLTLYPPLVKSVRHGGGYRCASNHIRP